MTGRPVSDISFPPFRLDVRDQSLRRGTERIDLRPKTYAVLCCLLDHAGELVTKEELVATAWPEVAVSDSVLKVCIAELRQALGDDASQPRFIETAHRRGYRFVGRLGEGGAVSDETAAVPSPGSRLVGREPELEQLRRLTRQARGGQRTVVFVTGEAGIGKTALVQAALARGNPSLAVAHGQCLEHYGGGEPYLPVLEAFSRLLREREGLVDVLARHAPTWLAQMPAVRPTGGGAPASAASTSERMLREMAEGIEACTREMPLALVLEDLHWSDPSTIALLSYLGRRSEAARLLVVGTYRPAGLAASHPLRVITQDLQAHGRCHELRLGFLPEPAVEDYLRHRFPGRELPAALASTVHQRTDGNPLFMVNLVDYLLAGGMLREDEAQLYLAAKADALRIPETIREMVDGQLEALPAEDQGLLEAASVAGFEFLALAAAGEVPDGEARLHRLARRQLFLRPLAPLELPGGEPAEQLGFIHALYEQVLYERVPAARRAELHRRTAERLEDAYGGDAASIAAELAMHFERGGRPARAASYSRHAAENAARRFAPTEAADLSARGLRLLERVSDSPERMDIELHLQLARGVALLATEGYASPAVERTYTRGLELANRLGQDHLVFPILVGLWGCHLLRAELPRARELADELLRLAEAASDPLLAIHARFAALVTSVNLGEFARAREHMEAGLLLDDPAQHQAYIKSMGHDAGVTLRCFGAWTLWSLGQPALAERRLDEARTRARAFNDPHSFAFAAFFSAFVHQLRGEPGSTRRWAEETIRVADEHAFPQWQAFGRILHGWATAMEGDRTAGTAELRAALAAYRGIGAELSRPHFLGLLAQALAGEAGDEARAALTEALAESRRTGGRYYEAELLRRQAEELAQSDPSAARSSLHEAVTLARQQQACPFELRAALLLVRMAGAEAQPEARRALRDALARCPEREQIPEFGEAQGLAEA